MALSEASRPHYLEPEPSRIRRSERICAAPQQACINPKQHLVEFKLKKILGLWYPASDHTLLDKKDIHDVDYEFQDFDEAGVAEEKYLRFESFFRDQSKSLKGLPRGLLIWPERALKPSRHGSGVIAYIRVVGFRRWKHVKACNKLLSSKDWLSMYSPPLHLCYDIQPSGLRLTAGPRDARLLGPRPRETLCGSLVRVGSGDDERIVTVGGVIEVNQRSWAITTNHIPCRSGGSTPEDTENDEDDSGFGDDQDSTLDPVLATVSGDGEQSDQPHDGNKEASGDTATYSSTALGQIGPEGSDWALIPLDEPILRLPNSFCPMGCSQAIYLSQQADKPSSDLIWIIAGVTGLFQARMSPARIQIPLPSGVWVKVWKVKFEGPKSLHRGDSGSWVASNDGVVFGQIIARTDDYAYLLPLRDLLDEVTVKIGATERAHLPDAFDALLNLAHAWFDQASGRTHDHDVAMATSRRLASEAIRPEILSLYSVSKSAEIVQSYLRSRRATSSLTERTLVEVLMRNGTRVAGLAAELRLMRQNEALNIDSKDSQLPMLSRDTQQATNTIDNLVKAPENLIPPAEVLQSSQMDTNTDEDTELTLPENREPKPQEKPQKNDTSTMAGDAGTFSASGLQGQSISSKLLGKAHGELPQRMTSEDDIESSAHRSGVAGLEIVAHEILHAAQHLESGSRQLLTAKVNELLSTTRQIKQQIAKREEDEISTTSAISFEYNTDDRWHRWQTLYQIDHVFDEEPLWRENAHGVLIPRTNRPIYNLEGYMLDDRKKDIAFYVVNCYDTDSTALTSSAPGNMARPQPDSQIIKMRSPALIEAIRALLKMRPRYDDWSIFNGSTLMHPEVIWYHYRSHFDNDIETLPTLQKRLMRLFQDWIEHEYSEEWRYVEDRFREGLVSPASIKYFARPGDVLVSYKGNKVESSMVETWAIFEASNTATSPPGGLDWSRVPSISNIDASRTEWNIPRQSESSQASVYHWTISSWEWTLDGDTFHDFLVETRWTVMTESPQHFVKISSLEIIPIRFAGNDVEERLRRRGHTFWRLRQPSLLATDCKRSDLFERVRENRYMIDVSLYHLPGRRGVENTWVHELLSNEDTTIYSKNADGEISGARGLGSFPWRKLPDGPELLVSPRVIRAYDLSSSKWTNLDVDDLRDVTWDIEAFDRLVLDDVQKSLIRDVATNQAEHSVHGSLTTGRTVILLHGNTGTGKTLAAEAVAELVQKPLLRITCGQIGSDFDKATKTIEGKMRLATVWNCVVVLENFGKLLFSSEAKDSSDRHVLLSIFENILETHQGIVIITIRQPPDEIDEAIMSRIQLAINCPSLDQPTRKRIWSSLLRRFRSQEHSDDVSEALGSPQQLDKLAQYRMNGWQISNAIICSASLARRKSKPLDYECLLEWLSLTVGFPLIETSKGPVYF